VPVTTLARVMTEREFRSWQKYAERRMLPTRRMEFYLAQIALLIARTMGNNQEATLADFLFDPDAESSEDDLEAAKEALDFSPRNKD